MATSKQKHSQLKNLSKTIKTSIYDMLKLTDELLSDHDYVDAFGGEDQLIDSLEADEFSHFGGSPSLPEMLRAYRHTPKLAAWKEYRFNIRAMIELAKPERESEAKERINWRALAKELESKVARLESALDQYRKSDSEKDSQIRELTAELGELRGELKAVQRYAKVA